MQKIGSEDILVKPKYAQTPPPPSQHIHAMLMVNRSSGNSKHCSNQHPDLEDKSLCFKVIMSKSDDLMAAIRALIINKTRAYNPRL